ncbi:MAG TPA: mechanosensitive ion channel domain-containing protein [Longimicrobiales bacterium]|nr:mechanosensitive ion channel domain-containing protein [Longimicrobiales bacterium]
MDITPEFWSELPHGVRLVLIPVVAIAAHLAVRAVHRLGEWILTPANSPRVARELVKRRHPKVATVAGLVVSAVTFALYFFAVGLMLNELGVELKDYLVTATVVGLAVGFGLQGLVQDVVTGLTLIFSDVLDIGDVIEVAGQVGRVEKIGLRFTTLVTFVGATVNVPNRNIAHVSRYRRGMIRAYVDVEVPPSVPEAEVQETVERIARGIRSQYPAVVVTDPESFGVFDAEGGWRYLRVKFRLWPGQTQVIETAFRQRLLAALKSLDPAYQDWMVSVTYRVPPGRAPQDGEKVHAGPRANAPRSARSDGQP